MKGLVDNALSPAVATLLTQAGHDALHVRTIEFHRAEDVVIFERAATDNRIVFLRTRTSAGCWPLAACRSLQ
jgi:predicted nuclease of predicted toxin-antitoxin system